MMPMTTLVGGLVSGAFLTGSACALFFNKRKGVMLYRLSAILLMFFPINSILLDILYGYVQDLVLSTILFFPIGLFLYLFFRSKKYPKSHTAALFMIGVGVYLFIDPVFYDWSYF